MKTSYLYRVAGKAPKLFRSRKWRWHNIWYRCCGYII